MPGEQQDLDLTGYITIADVAHACGRSLGDVKQHVGFGSLDLNSVESIALFLAGYGSPQLRLNIVRAYGRMSPAEGAKKTS